MATGRRGQIRDICYTVLDQEPSERHKLLDILCGGDTALRREVEAMMADASEVGDDSLLDRPAWEALGAVLAEAPAVLAPGTRLGSYEIGSLLGAGGMGQVYRARDQVLQRDVAIKVLPSGVAPDGQSLERLRREAKHLAALNHRNIAAIYGVHEADDVLALVMELVEGPTLANRLTAGPIPLEELLPIARQIAEAVEAAHDRGIIHRDLKPANVVVRPDGEVKVLDFGIAKTLDPTAVEPDKDGSVTDSLTVAGAAIGTPSYMSPEQLRGQAVDRRTDLWAFGLLLWEMLTGRQPFAADSVVERATLVLSAEPDWTMLPPGTPEPIRRLLTRTLQKDRRRRLDSAAVARIELDEALAPEVKATAWSAARVLPWAVAAASLIAVAALWGSRSSVPAVGNASQAQVTADLGADVVLRDDFGPAIVLSPDGRTLVFSTRETDAPAMLYVRRLDELAARPLGSTENANNPFFSPDGKWVAFFADRKLKRISLSGGAAAVIADAGSGRGGAWGADDSIVFANNARATLQRVSAAGGTTEPVTTFVDGEASHRWPQILPENRGVLYTSNTSDNWENARVMVQPPAGGAPKVVIQEGFFGRYAASGHLLYMRGGTLFAAPFDLESLQVTGPSVSVVNEVAADTTTGGAQFALSDSGTLVYLRGRSYAPSAPAVWMDRGGNMSPLRAMRTQWGNPQFSPDGTLLAFDVGDGKQTDIWIEVLATGQLSRLTFDPADDFDPVWTPDGQRITFSSTRDGAPNLYWVRADGSGPTERLTRSDNAQSAGSWHPGGKLLAFEETRPGTAADIMTVPVTPDGSGWKVGTPEVFAAGPAVQAKPAFSPDGRWLAYRSTETGTVEIFVQSFGGAGGRWQVSSGGGRDATWSRTTQELLYFGTAQDRIMLAPFSTAAGSFRPGAPRPWSIVRLGRPPRTGRLFDLHPDGARVVTVPAESPRSMTLWFDFLARLRQPETSSGR